MKTQKPNLGDWMTIGKLSAIVCNTYGDCPNRIEIIYIDRRNRAIAEDVVFIDGEWQFEKNSSGTHADNSLPHQEYISLLKRGRFPR